MLSGLFREWTYIWRYKPYLGSNGSTGVSLWSWLLSDEEVKKASRENRKGGGKKEKMTDERIALFISFFLISFNLFLITTLIVNNMKVEEKSNL